MIGAYGIKDDKRIRVNTRKNCQTLSDIVRAHGEALHPSSPLESMVSIHRLPRENG
jgi:hypothetical protein